MQLTGSVTRTCVLFVLLGGAGCRRPVDADRAFMSTGRLVESLRDGHKGWVGPLLKTAGGWSFETCEASPIPELPLFEVCSLKMRYRVRRFLAAGEAQNWLGCPGGEIAAWRDDVGAQPGDLPPKEVRDALLAEPNWLCQLAYVTHLHCASDATEVGLVCDSRLLLAHKDRRVRLWTLCALDGVAFNMQGPTGAHEEITALLVRLLGDPDGRVREVAASLLRRSGTADALEPVSRLLDDDSQPLGVRVQAAWAFVELHEEAWPEWCQAHGVFSDEFKRDGELVSTALRFRGGLCEGGGPARQAPADQ